MAKSLARASAIFNPETVFSSCEALLNERPLRDNHAAIIFMTATLLRYLRLKYYDRDTHLKRREKRIR